MIQGLIVLFVGADMLILYVWNTRRRLRAARARGGDGVNASRSVPPGWERLRDPRPASPGSCSACSRASSRCRRSTARSVVWPIVVGVAAATLGLWAASADLRRLGWGAVAAA